MEWGDRPEARKGLLADQLPFRSRGTFPCNLNKCGPITFYNIQPLVFIRVTQFCSYANPCSSFIIPDVTGALNPAGSPWQYILVIPTAKSPAGISPNSKLSNEIYEELRKVS